MTVPTVLLVLWFCTAPIDKPFCCKICFASSKLKPNTLGTTTSARLTDTVNKKIVIRNN